MPSKIKLRDYQQDAVDGIRAAYKQGRRAVLFVLPTGGGKCLGRGTPVLMFDGTIKPVEDIQVGDLLMGPDSAPRRVLSLARGRELLYRVTPTKGDAYVVNESHILSLKRTPTKAVPLYPSQSGGQVVNIGVREYLASSRTFKHTHKGWRAAVDFAPRDPTKLEPYFLGLWLGDGHSHLSEITTADEEVVQYLIGYADRMGMRLGWRDNSELSIGVRMVGLEPTGRGGTAIMNELRSFGLVRNKHIPHRFKTGSRQERLDLLAGLIDTDGHYTGKGYDITLGSERLMDDLVFVARSLGLSAYKAPSRKTCHNNGVTGDYWRCTISGDVDQIPCRIARKKAAPRQQKKDVLVTGITVTPIGEGDYFGFEIDGDHLFMLGDFTVTHNTYTFSYIASSAADKGRPTCIIVHRKELLLQASASLTNLGIEHGLISPDFTPKKHAMVQVASVDTLLQRLKKQSYKFGMLIYDEAHHVVEGNKWGRVYEQLGKPVMLGVTATPVRTDGKGLGTHAGGVFEAMVLGPSVVDLIRRGMLINPKVYASPVVPEGLDDVKTNRDGTDNLQALAAIVDRPRITGSAVEHYTKICPSRRAIVFCSSIEHAKHVAAEFNAAGYRFELLVGAPHMSDAERTAVNLRLRRGEIHGACTVDLVSEGYDLPDLECCIMLRPTASEALFLQQVGRVMRPSEGKTECWLLDHVGNVGAIHGGEFKRKHGLPNEEREWTLDGRKKRKKKKGDDEPEEPKVDIKQCPDCFTTHEAAPQCPTCGHVYEAKAPRSLQQVDGNLQLVTEELQRRQEQQRLRSAQAAAKTVEDMMNELGFSRGRAEAIVKAREEKAQLRTALIDDLRAWQQRTGQSPQQLFGIYLSDLKAYKPKALKDLREKFDSHRLAHLGARPGDDAGFAEFLHDTLSQPQGQEPAF